MKKIRCLLVDDEPLAIKLLQNHIAQMDNMEVAGTCQNAVKALWVLKQQPIDLLFLDIQMPGLSGIDLLKTVRNPPKTIFTTAFPDYALDGYDLDVIDYLLKPVTFDRFCRAVERYLRSIGQLGSAPSPAEAKQFIYVKSGYRQVKVDLSEILYIESVKDYIKLCTLEKEIITRYKISEMETELNGNGFLRIHRSFMVNLNRVTAFTAATAEIGKVTIPIGESYKEHVLSIIKNIPK